MKKMLSFILVLSLMLGLASPAFAAEEASIPAVSENVRIEEINDSILYTYSDDEIVYSSQTTYDGYINFAYVKNGQNEIYESKALKLDEIVAGIDTSELSKEYVVDNIDLLNGYVMDRLDNFDVTSTMNVDVSTTQANLGNAAELNASTSISAMLDATFGSNYSGTYIGYAQKTYDGVDYAVYCRASQSTYEIKNAEYAFAAGKTITAIAAWLTIGGFSCSVSWFLSVAGAIIATIDAVECIENAISGNMCVYECNRTRIVTVPAYTSATLYWAGWTLKSTFVDNGSTWDVDTFHDVKHSDYDDVQGLIEKGFNNFVLYHR